MRWCERSKPDPDIVEYDVAAATRTGIRLVAVRSGGFPDDGTNRETIAATGRVPSSDTDGRILFHTDAYAVSLRTASATVSLGPGANAVWW